MLPLFYNFSVVKVTSCYSQLTVIVVAVMVTLTILIVAFINVAMVIIAFLHVVIAIVTVVMTVTLEHPPGSRPAGCLRSGNCSHTVSSAAGCMCAS